MINRRRFDLLGPASRRRSEHRHAVSTAGHGQSEAIICRDRSPDQPNRRGFKCV